MTIFLKYDDPFFVLPPDPGIFAFADVGPLATIFVLKHPSGEKLSVLGGGAKLDVA